MELAPDEKHQNWHSEDLKGQDLKGNMAFNSGFTGGIIDFHKWWLLKQIKETILIFS